MSSYDAAIAILAGPAAARSSPAASSATKEEPSSRASGDAKEAEPLISPLGALLLACVGLGGYALYKQGKQTEAVQKAEDWIESGPATDYPRLDNPAPWVRDEEIWERAKAEVLPDWEKYDQPWAVVAHVYEQMGGRIA